MIKPGGRPATRTCGRRSKVAQTTLKSTQKIPRGIGRLEIS
jgi:hypothetical protein